MRLARFWRHVLMNPMQAARAFPVATMDAIEREIAAHEKLHRGEVCFVVEAELSSAQLWAELSTRERARQVFAQRGVWNTEENNGVLIYLLLADHGVEVVADRGIDARAGADEWQRICRMIEAHFREGRYEEGAIAGVSAVSLLLERHFPAKGEDNNELSNRPARI